MRLYRVTRTYSDLVLAPNAESAELLADDIEDTADPDDIAEELTDREARSIADTWPATLLYHAGTDDIRLDEAIKRHIDPDYPAAPPPPDDPPPSAWIEWHGERWATDGYVLVREGTPLPAPNRYRKWRDLTDDQADQMRRWLDAAYCAPDPASAEHLGRIGCEYAPLVAAADVRSAPWPGDEAIVLLATLRGGRLAAVTSVRAEAP